MFTTVLHLVQWNCVSLVSKYRCFLQNVRSFLFFFSLKEVNFVKKEKFCLTSKRYRSISHKDVTSGENAPPESSYSDLFCISVLCDFLCTCSFFLLINKMVVSNFPEMSLY